MSDTRSIADQLRLDPAPAIAEIVSQIRVQVRQQLRRRGTVVGLSGGVDSSVCAALAVTALSADRVFGLLMPEIEAEDEDVRHAAAWADELGIDYSVQDITGILEASGAYRRRDEAIRGLVAGFGRGWRCKIGLGNDRLEGGRLPVFFLTVRDPKGATQTLRLPSEAYREIVAATNLKQRIRKMLEYHHADRLHYAVLGTPNRLEYDQGFFVKGGDGLADLKPIAHLYKTQVYQLADYLGVPDSIRIQKPTTGTYSLHQTQAEFYFSVPVEKLDIALYGYNHGLAREQVAAELGYSVEMVAHVYRDIERKRSATRYLHMAPLLVRPVQGVG